MNLQEIDSSNGVLFIFYDPDTSMVYLAGKASLLYSNARIELNCHETSDSQDNLIFVVVHISYMNVSALVSQGAVVLKVFENVYKLQGKNPLQTLTHRSFL